jgi:hypothetical protein
MSKSIWSLEKEREKYSGEAAEADAKYQQVCGVRHEMQMLVCEWSFVPQHHCHGRVIAWWEFVGSCRALGLGTAALLGCDGG